MSTISGITPQNIKGFDLLKPPSEHSPNQQHAVLQHPIYPPFPGQLSLALFGMGCFWGAEKRFWQTPGVYTTAVGYSGGETSYPNYQQVCTDTTGHNEVVLVVFDPTMVNYLQLLKVFWQSHDPTQGMRQGNDHGSQYRSGIYTVDDEQLNIAYDSRQHYQTQLNNASFATITTEITAASTFYYAELYHQQYLAKNPGGYCGLGGTGVHY